MKLAVCSISRHSSHRKGYDDVYKLYVPYTTNFLTTEVRGFKTVSKNLLMHE